MNPIKHAIEICEKHAEHHRREGSDEVTVNALLYVAARIKAECDRCPNCGHLRSSPMSERHDRAGKECDLCRTFAPRVMGTVADAFSRCGVMHPRWPSDGCCVEPPGHHPATKHRTGPTDDAGHCEEW